MHEGVVHSGEGYDPKTVSSVQSVDKNNQQITQISQFPPV